MKKTSKITKKQFGSVSKINSKSVKSKKANVKAGFASNKNIDVSIEDLGYKLNVKPSKPTLSRVQINKLFLSPDKK